VTLALPELVQHRWDGAASEVHNLTLLLVNPSAMANIQKILGRRDRDGAYGIISRVDSMNIRMRSTRWQTTVIGLRCSTNSSSSSSRNVSVRAKTSHIAQLTPHLRHRVLQTVEFLAQHLELVTPEHDHSAGPIRISGLGLQNSIIVITAAAAAAVVDILPLVRRMIRTQLWVLPVSTRLTRTRQVAST